MRPFFKIIGFNVIVLKINFIDKLRTSLLRYLVQFYRKYSQQRNTRITCKRVLQFFVNIMCSENTERHKVQRRIKGKQIREKSPKRCTDATMNLFNTTLKKTQTTAQDRSEYKNQLIAV